MTFLKYFSFVFVKREKLKFIIKITLTLFIQSLYPRYFGCKRTAKEQQGNPLGLLAVLPSEGFTGGCLLCGADLTQFPSSSKEHDGLCFQGRGVLLWQTRGLRPYFQLPRVFFDGLPLSWTRRWCEASPSAREGDAPQQATGLPGLLALVTAGIAGCGADRTSGREQLAPCTLPSHPLSPSVIFLPSLLCMTVFCAASSGGSNWLTLAAANGWFTKREWENKLLQPIGISGGSEHV